MLHYVMLPYVMLYYIIILYYTDVYIEYDFRMEVGWDNPGLERQKKA